MSAKKGVTGSAATKLGVSGGAAATKKARIATGSATTKKSCMETACDSETNQAQVEEEEANNVFSHDLDTLQCDICCMPFEAQVSSCKNGHAACGDCCVMLDRKCPSCNDPIGDYRCRATEKILAGMTRPCKHKKHGCKHIARFTEIRTHEEDNCRHAPYRCPFHGCLYLVPHLRGHMSECKHNHGGPFLALDLFGRLTLRLNKSTPFCVLLHPDGDESVFLLLNGGDVPTGRTLSVVRLYPPVDENGAAQQQYTMSVKGDQPGSLSLTSGTVQFVRRLDQGYNKRRGFLFVPDACWGSCRSVTVDVTVYP